MSLFEPAALARLAGFAQLYSGFSAKWNFQLPIELEGECLRFIHRKGWSQLEGSRFINSKKADYLLVRHAQSQGFVAELNNEAETKNPWYDFAVALPGLGMPLEWVKFETKRMQAAGSMEIAFLWPFNKTETCMKWRDHDIFVAWHVDDVDRFKPWALISNRLFAHDMWETIWEPNNGEKGGRHLSLGKLSDEHLAGVAFL